MPKGGARTHSGPPPDPNALRRDRKNDGEWTTLPERREGAAPAWPLTEQTGREARVWAAYWSKPQAILWERNGQEFEVAIHVRHLVESESIGTGPSARTLLRQQFDSLLLTLPAMRSARIRVVEDQVGAQRETRKPALKSSRSRLKVATGGDA